MGSGVPVFSPLSVWVDSGFVSSVSGESVTDGSVAGDSPEGVDRDGVVVAVAVLD